MKYNFNNFFIFIFFLFVIFYLGFQIKSLVFPPKIIIEKPIQDSFATNEEKQEFKGKTDSYSNLTINNQTVYLNENGEFKEEISLKEGINEFEIKVINRLKMISIIKKTIIYSK